MSKMKEKNLRRFIAFYIAGSVAFGGVAYAGESEDESVCRDGIATTVTAGSEFDGVNELYGGSDKWDGGNHSIPETDITVESGKVGSVTGGSSSENNTTVHVGTANITIAGGNVDYIQGGGEADYNNATSTVDTVNITITGGNISEKPFSIPGEDGNSSGISGGGMAWAGEIANETNTSNVKTVNMTITGGTIYKPDNADSSGVWGGGIAGYDGTESTAKASVHVDTVNMNISGGTIHPDIYAGGATFDDSDDGSGAGKITSTVDNATINISGGDIKGNVYAGGMNAATVGNSTINISGGKIGGNISAEQNVTGSKTLNFTAGTGSTVDGKISGFQTITVKEDAVTTLTGEHMTADESHGFTNLQVEQKGTLNISGGTFQSDIQGAGNTKASALNFTTGKGSTIDGTISGFDTVTVANGAKTDWTKNTTHTLGSLTVEAGGEINITGTAVTFDFALPSTAAYALRAARDVQNGDFNVNGAVNLAQGTVLTLKNGTVETGSNGAFVSAVDKTTFENSGKLQYDSTAKVKAGTELHIDFSGIDANELEAMGKTDDFKDLLQEIAGSPTSEDGEPVIITNRDNPTSETTFGGTVDSNGNISIVDAPRVSERGFSYYTSARQGNAYIAQNIVNNIHEHTAGLRNGEETDTFWASIRGGSTDVDTRFGDAEVNTQFYQLGYDWDVSSNDRKAAVGLYFSKIEGDMKQKGVKNDLESAYDFGIYGMQELGGGNYLSLIGRYGHIGNSLHLNDTTVDWKDKGYGLSMEFGNKHTQANGLMIEPYVQLNYNHLSSTSFVSSMGTSVSMDSSALLDGKIGLRLIQQETDNPNNIVYGGIAYTRGLSGDFSMIANQGAKLIEEDNDANAFELTIGMNRQISKCSTLNLNAKKEFGDYDGWSLQGMVNVAF